MMKTLLEIRMNILKRMKFLFKLTSSFHRVLHKKDYQFFPSKASEEEKCGRREKERRSMEHFLVSRAESSQLEQQKDWDLRGWVNKHKQSHIIYHWVHWGHS